MNAFVRDSGMLTYNSGAIENFEKFTLVINGHDRFAEKEASYFRLYTPVTAGYKVPSKHIYYYSFSLKRIRR